MNTDQEIFSVQMHVHQILKSYSFQQKVKLKCFNCRMYSLLKGWRRVAAHMY